MCRNIRRLYNVDPPATEAEIRDAALQFVRKVSGYRTPSQANALAFERTVEDVAQAVHALLAELATNAPPQDRELAAEQARARAAKRYGDSPG